MSQTILQKTSNRCLQAICLVCVLASISCSLSQEDIPYFATPKNGFTSDDWVHNTQEFRHGLLTGNGTSGAIVLGRPYDENIYISHASLYLPNTINEDYIRLDSLMPHIQALCLKGDYKQAGQIIQEQKEAQGYADERDPFIGAFYVHVNQPKQDIIKYQRAVDYTTAEAIVDVTDERGTFRRSTFASRKDTLIVMKLSGSDTQSAEISFKALETFNDDERKMQQEGVRLSEHGVRNGYLYFRTLFAHQNRFNPNIGFEGIGKVITKGGETITNDSSIIVKDADEILLLVKVEPILKASGETSITHALQQKINSVSTQYNTLLKAHTAIHGELMNRVSFSLEAPTEDRTLSNEQLFDKSAPLDAPLALTERAFKAGRYNIICSTGFNPPNLQGLWSASWFARWKGSFTTNGNLPCAISNNLMGNLPELMAPYFKYYDQRWDDFRENARILMGTRGFHVPAQLTVSPRETDFVPGYPHNYWHAGAAWACQYYYDYYQYTGDIDFLSQKAYPLMKEACAFYEDFLNKKDSRGKLFFAPSYSPENYASGGPPTSINATMDIAAAKQLLRHTIKASKLLQVDEHMRPAWSNLIQNLPSYQVDEQGYFREWLWPGLKNNNNHRHASLLYPLYDERPAEIINNPELLAGIKKYLTYHLDYKSKHKIMAFGIVQDGLAAAHTGHKALTQKAIKVLLSGFWTRGMGSMHDAGRILNTDISGGFPYLCSSALVYADPGYIKLLPGLPPQWKNGAIKGLRLRGGILLNKLHWTPTSVEAILKSDKTQTVQIELDGKTIDKELTAGVQETIVLESFQ